MPISRDDIILGYRDILGLPAPDEAKIQELLRTYDNLKTFQRRLRESNECQRIVDAAE